jgi:GNAT superfamily N-acetyltransferase
VSQEIRASVRALAAQELAAVERALPPAYAALHASRLADQFTGQVLYLIAWVDTRPIGHVMLRWRGSTNPALRAVFARYGRHPYIEDLFVHAELRSRTIGSQLLATAEQQAVRNGHENVGLAVAQENVRARALYDRCGYRNVQAGQLLSRSSYADGDGYLQTRIEECIYLMKALPALTPDPRRPALKSVLNARLRPPQPRLPQGGEGESGDY